MNRIGHDSSPNSATNPIEVAERDRAPGATRHAPTASRTTVASVGSASRAASNVARTYPPRHAVVAERLRACVRRARSVSRCLAAERLHDERAVDRLVRDGRDVADVLLRQPGRLFHALGEARGSSARGPGTAAAPTNASQGSARSSWTIASTDQDDHADGERHRPEHVDRGLHVGLHVGEQLAGRGLAVILELELAVPVRDVACEAWPSRARRRRPSSSAGP